MQQLEPKFARGLRLLQKLLFRLSGLKQIRPSMHWLSLLQSPMTLPLISRASLRVSSIVTKNVELDPKTTKKTNKKHHYMPNEFRSKFWRTNGLTELSLD